MDGLKCEILIKFKESMKKSFPSSMSVSTN